MDLLSTALKRRMCLLMMRTLNLTVVSTAGNKVDTSMLRTKSYIEKNAAPG